METEEFGLRKGMQQSHSLFIWTRCFNLDFSSIGGLILMIWIFAGTCNAREVQIDLNSGSYGYELIDNHGFDTTGLTSIAFKVKACKDVHVGLLMTNDVNGALYEIVIGGWSNQISVIRRSKQGLNEVTHAGTYLDCNNFKNMWVSWIGGVIRVGIGCQVGSSTIMRYDDPSPRAITHVAVGTHYTVMSWIFDLQYDPDCYADSTTEGTTMDQTYSETTFMTSTQEPSESIPTHSETSLWIEKSTQTTSSVNRSSSEICWCNCPISSISDINDPILLKKIEEMKKKITVYKNETNKYKRTLISMPDNRTSARVIGFSGVFVLVIVIGFIVILDADHVIHCLTKKG